MIRETYAVGYKTSDDAYQAMYHMIARGEISEGESPAVTFYCAGPKDSKGIRHLPRYAITVQF